MITSCKDKCRCNPIRNFSANEVLEATNHFESYFHDSLCYKWYNGTLDDRPVLVKKYECDFEDREYRDIAIITQMSCHKNVLKLLGCCLELSCPVLVYEYAHHGPLDSVGIIGFGSQGLSLSWKIRLKVAKSNC
ncbi:hypothetical protein TIFTF001_046732 [Ficus carica]|uniref:Serine-threonine/tyrosine-protein kinase catalytic domain-containing protein n=1 Tax=Ficus carica TaxID=3494 RepID=A0AA87ZUU1_FICCA|nr:hypothetical protein TIFTF001_046732 [Ficus carica]